MSYYKTKTPAERKAWGAKMKAARDAKYNKSTGRKTYYRGRGAYYESKNKKPYKRKPIPEKYYARNRIVDTLAPLATAGLSALGTAVGGPLLGAAGGIVGELGGQAMKYFSGRGDYKVQANSLLQGSNPPIINHNTHGGVVFRGTEYLGDIISGNANTFNIQNFNINAALESTFPKLAQIACNFEQYIIEGMYFEFRSMSADALNSTNTSLGQIILACNYNATSPNFGSKQSMEEYEGGISVKPAENICFFVECARSQTPLDVLWTRAGPVTSGQDQRLYDLGNFQIATNGMQGTNVNCGELWCTYQVCLLKSKLYSGLGNYNSALVYYSTSYTNTAPLGGGAATVPYNSGFSFQGNGTKIQFPVSPLIQSYIVQVCWSGTATAITQPTLSYSGCSAGNLSYSQGPVNATLATGAVDTVTVMFMNFYIVTNPNAVPQVTFSGGVYPSSPTGFWCRINQVSNLAGAING